MTKNTPSGTKKHRESEPESRQTFMMVFTQNSSIFHRVVHQPIQVWSNTSLMWERCLGWGWLNCFMLSSLPCFYAICWSAIPTSCYIFWNFLFLLIVVFPWCTPPTSTCQSSFPVKYPQVEYLYW